MVFLFSEEFPVKKSVPFDLPLEQPGFPCKWKALLVATKNDFRDRFAMHKSRRLNKKVHNIKIPMVVECK